MKTSDRITILSKKFELLKVTYVKENNDKGSIFYSIIKGIIIPILNLDIDLVCDMWIYMLKKYTDCSFIVH